MADFSHVTRGKKFAVSAEEWNGMLDAAVLAKTFAARTPRAVDPPGLRANEILVKNSSGADRARFEVVGLATGPVISPVDSLAGFHQLPALVAALPTTADYFGKFAILQEPVKSGSLGRAVACGLSYVKIEVAQTWHQRADVTNSSAAKLTSCPQGAAQIIWAESGTGEKWALVHIGSVLEVVLDSKAPSAWSAGGDKTCTIYRAGSSTGWTQTVTFDSWTSTETISSGKNVRIRWSRDKNKWIVHEAECE